MRILIINPNSDTQTNAIMRRTVDEFVGDSYEVDIVCVKNAPKLVSSYEDYSKSTDEMIKIVKESGDKYDAFIIACHSDPNLDLIKEIAKKPVVGIAEASMKFATMMGNGFAVISPSVKSISKKFALARKYHCDHLLRTIKVTKSDSPEDLLEASKKAKEELCVDSIVLGCANYSNADWYVEKNLGIPVLDGVVCALIMASGLVRYREYKNR